MISNQRKEVSECSAISQTGCGFDASESEFDDNQELVFPSFAFQNACSIPP